MQESGQEYGQAGRACSTHVIMSSNLHPVITLHMLGILGPKRREAYRRFPLDSDQDKNDGVKGFRICKLLNDILKLERGIY